LDIHMGVLIALQERDSEIQRLQARRAECPVQIEVLRQGIAQVETQLKTLSEGLEVRSRERRERERVIEDLDAGIGKSNQKLGNVKSNKEYHAALKEIADLGGDKKRLEDQLLEIMESTEALEKERLGLVEEKERTGLAFEAGRNRITSELRELDGELNKLLEERNRLCAEVDRGVLKRYELLRKSKGGTAVSAVVKGICQTCHLRIPPQEFNELIRGEQLMNCPHCHRIIYWGERKGAQEVGESGGMPEQDGRPLPRPAGGGEESPDSTGQDAG
jgi:uncharacterized protein